MASPAAQPPPAYAGGSVAEAVRELEDVAYHRAVDGPGLHVLAPLLRGRLALQPGTVDLAVDALAREAAQVLLTHGWTPRELYRFAARRLDSTAMSYFVDTLAAGAQVTVAPPWDDELADLGAHVWWSVGQPHLSQWAARHAHKRVEAVRAAVEVLALLCHLPRTEHRLPGSPDVLALEPGTLVHDPRIAAKIDALLARAGDTTYPEEARACAGKAQQLMIRYATVPQRPPAPTAAATATATVTAAAAAVAHVLRRLAAAARPVVPGLTGLAGLARPATAQRPALEDH